MTINVTSLKGCRPHPTLLVLHSLPPDFILFPKTFPFHPLPLILVLGIRWWGHGEQGNGSPGDDLGRQSCSPLSLLAGDRRNLTESLSGAPLFGFAR